MSATDLVPTGATSSFVTEVLATAGELCREDVNSKLSRLSRRVEEVKVEVYDGLQRKYQDFYPCLDATLALSSRVQSLMGDMETQAKKIELEIKMQLDTSTSKFQELSGQLGETKVITIFLERLVAINDALQSIDTHLGKFDYLSASEDLVKIHELMEHPIPGERDINVFRILQEHYVKKTSIVRSDICEAWRNNVKWVLPKRGEEQKNLKIELHIVKSKDNKTLEDLVQAMYNVGLLDEELKTFSDRCLKYVIGPVLHRHCTMVKEEQGSKEFKLIVITRDEKKEAVGPTEAFKKLSFVFELLGSNMLGVVIKEKSANEEEEPEGMRSVQLITKLGDIMADNLLNLIIEDCLAPSVPSSNTELKEYYNIISTTESFQKNMQNTNLISETNKQLTDFVGSVNVLFANKKCEEILKQARQLMTSDVHNMVKISNDSPFGQELLSNTGGEGGKSKKAKMLENTSLQCEKKLSAKTFQFPTCQISVFVQDLIQLVYETLQEATSSSPQCATQLFYCVRNVFELFFDVVPTYHKQILMQLPQITALHHNNCMYIAHHLLTLGHQYAQYLPEPLNQGAATFVDLVPKIRRLGTESFLQQMQNQRTEMMNLLGASANGFQNISTDENFMSAERALKQCLHQLRHLASVWRDVLPTNIYTKSLGTLLNSLILEIINSVVSLEDISADDATQLHKLMSIVTEKSPDQFRTIEDQEEGEVQATLHQSVAKWKKFQELMFMMNASLQDITDRWTDGKGPLAHQFTANEVKQLIRALFQNTERRSQTLAKIK